MVSGTFCLRVRVKIKIIKGIGDTGRCFGELRLKSCKGFMRLKDVMVLDMKIHPRLTHNRRNFVN